jgi:hypothetical protein
VNGSCRAAEPLSHVLDEEIRLGAPELTATLHPGLTAPRPMARDAGRLELLRVRTRSNIARETPVRRLPPNSHIALQRIGPRLPARAQVEAAAHRATLRPVQARRSDAGETRVTATNPQARQTTPHCRAPTSLSHVSGPSSRTRSSGSFAGEAFGINHLDVGAVARSHRMLDGPRHGCATGLVVVEGRA